MIRTIEINDSENEVLIAELKDILNIIGIDGADYNWAIMYLYATGSINSYSNISDFEEEIAASKKGYMVSWAELNDLASMLSQTHDILIAGNLNAPITKKLASDESQYEEFDIVIDLFDNAYWRIHANSQEILCKVLDHFNDVKVIK